MLINLPYIAMSIRSLYTQIVHGTVAVLQRCLV